MTMSIIKEVWLMKIGYCQYNVIHSDIKSNLKTVKRLLKGCEADVVLLPELAFTGYYFESKEALLTLASKTNQDYIVSALQMLAQSENITIITGMAEAVGNRLFNSVFVINKTGVIGKHRKLNLTDNETIFDAGDTLQTVTVNGVKIGISICFETWFPESFRTLCDQGAEIIVVPANFGGPWTIDVIKVRALENSIPVVMCNRIGEEVIDGEVAEFCGHSQMVDHYGNVIAQANQSESLQIADIDINTPNRNHSLICQSMNNERKKYARLKSENNTQ